MRLLKYNASAACALVQPAAICSATRCSLTLSLRESSAASGEKLLGHIEELDNLLMVRHDFSAAHMSFCKHSAIASSWQETNMALSCCLQFRIDGFVSFAEAKDRPVAKCLSMAN